MKPSERPGAADGGVVVAKASTWRTGMASWPAAAAAATLALGILLAAGFGNRPQAQRADAPRIVVASTILAEPASQAALAIQVGPPGSVPGNTFVRLRGLPASVSLSEGYAIAPGSWAVPLFGLPTLKAIVPAGVAGRSEIIIHLVGVDGTTLAESRTALVVGPAAIVAPPERITADRPPQRSSLAVSPPPPAQAPAPAPERSAQPPPASLTAQDKERAERLIVSGDRHLEQGNIGAARMFFQRAADAGLANGALKMAATYDPAELDRLQVKVQGAIPDRAEARKWYERARALGAPEAEDRLARIGGS